MITQDPLIVRVDHIDDDGLDVDESLPTQWLTDTLAENTPFVPNGEAGVRLRLLHTDGVVYIRGNAKFELAAECSRCLGPVALTMNVAVDVAMVPAADEPVPASDGELQESDMGYSTYEGYEINLRGVVHDEVFLQMPMNPVCTDDCKGLCPGCGVNRNKEACACAAPIDHRWSALAKVKLN